jgi:hypothetical protein
VPPPAAARLVVVWRRTPRPSTESKLGDGLKGHGLERARLKPCRKIVHSPSFRPEQIIAYAMIREVEGPCVPFHATNVTSATDTSHQRNGRWLPFRVKNNSGNEYSIFLRGYPTFRGFRKVAPGPKPLLIPHIPDSAYTHAAQRLQLTPWRDGSAESHQHREGACPALPEPRAKRRGKSKQPALSKAEGWSIRNVWTRIEAQKSGHPFRPHPNSVIPSEVEGPCVLGALQVADFKTRRVRVSIRLASILSVTFGNWISHAGPPKM